MKEYEKACRILVKEFADKYFDKDRELWYIGDDPTGVVYINDNFFEISECYEFLKNKYPTKKVFDYVGYTMECYEEGIKPMTIKAYKHLKQPK